MYYIYVMATNASCAIVIEDQADQVGSANDFTCNGVPKKRKASDFLCRNAKLLGRSPRPRWGSLQRSPIPPSWCPPPAPSPGRCRPLLCPTYSHTFHCAPPPPSQMQDPPLGVVQLLHAGQLGCGRPHTLSISPYTHVQSPVRQLLVLPRLMLFPYQSHLAPHVCLKSPNSCLQKEIEYLLLGRPSRSLLTSRIEFPVHKPTEPSAILQSIVFVKRFIHLRCL